MRKAYVIYIVCFFAILLMPLAAYPLLRDRLDLNNYENRTLMTAEELSESDWKSFFPNLERAFEDYMPYKNESITVINWIDENIFHDLINQSVMVGKENWLFYKGNDCIQDYRGGYVLTTEELEAYAAAAEALSNALEDSGARLCIMITPNKEAIYGDAYLPDKVRKFSSQSRADQIVAYLRENTNVSVIYPKETLQKAAEEYQVWKKYDTHWNNLGAFVASQDLLGGLGMERTSLSDVTVAEDGTCSGDLAGMLGRTAKFSDDVSYQITDYNGDITCERTDYLQQSNLSFAQYESDALNAATLLCIGDSFLGSMEQYLSTDFAKTMFVHRDNYTSLERDLILDEKPDVVVFQTAERFLTYFADSMRRYAAMYEQ